VTEPTRFLSFVQVADRLGVNRGTLTRYLLPEPDVLIGNTRGWSADRIDAWAASRPGVGNHTPRAGGHRHDWQPDAAGPLRCATCGATRYTRPDAQTLADFDARMRETQPQRDARAHRKR
jgi:predicted DNA-binding transcriptional regulator AlpA